MVYIYDFSISLYPLNTRVYGLTGSIPSSTPENQEISQQNAYPNPANNFINIPYHLKGEAQAELVLANMSGREMNRVSLSNSSENLLLDTSILKPGNYIYYIETNGKRTLARKIVVK